MELIGKLVGYIPSITAIKGIDGVDCKPEKPGLPEEIDLGTVDKHDTIRLAETLNALIQYLREGR